MSEFKPGDVALVTVRGSAEEVMFLTESVAGVRWWVPADPISGLGSSFRPTEVAVIRRLAVIDPEDDEQVERLRVLYYDHMRSLPHDSPTLNQDSMQAALREYTSPAPPKPDEPKILWSLVVDKEGREYARTRRSERPWMDADGCYFSWDDIDVDRLLEWAVQR